MTQSESLNVAGNAVDGEFTPKRLRILFLTNRLPYPVTDGQSRRTYHILQGLSARNEVHLLSLCSSSKQADSTTIQHLRNFCHGVDVVLAPPKNFSLRMVIRLFRSLLSLKPYTFWRHYSRVFLRKSLDLIEGQQFDIVHCDILPIAYVIRSIRKTPCSLTDHDICYVKAARIAQKVANPVLKAMYFLEAAKLRRWEKAVFSEVSLGLVVSEVDKGILQNLTGRDDLEVIPNGVDPEEFAPHSAEPEPATLLWVGGFDYSPNRDAVRWLLTEIFPLVRERVPEVRLKLVGGGQSSSLRRLVGKDEFIEFAGFVDDPVPHLHAATVFVVPLRSGSGTRLKMLEAMAAGKAIVTTSLGAEGIRGEHEKHFLVADTPKEFAEMVTRAVKSSEIRSTLGHNARALVREIYDWRVIVEELQRHYERLSLVGPTYDVEPSDFPSVRF